MFLKKSRLLSLAFAILFCLSCASSADELCQAVASGDLQLVKSLIDKNPELLNAPDKEGKTPLLLAIEKDQTPIAEALIEAGADLNISDAENYSPLHYAAAEGYPDLVSLLLEKGATTINDTSVVKHGGMEGGWTPLHMAAMIGLPEIVQLLIKHGAAIEAIDGVQRTPLIIAAESNNVRVAEILIENGADINAEAIRGYTALLWGARNRSEEYVDLLIANKAQISPEALPQAFQTAVVTGMESLYKYALDLGLDIKELKERDPGLIFPASAGGAAEIVKSLVELGFDPAQTDDNGWTTLHYAASEGRTAVLKYLIESGQDINARNKRGETAFNLASSKNYNETADFLKSSGADTGEPVFPTLSGPYMGQKPPGDSPELFLPGIVTGPDRAHSSITFSPDGLEAFWTEMIPPGGRVAYMRVVDGQWTYPITADLDRDPTFSPDGTKLFFIKTRPLKKGEKPGGDQNLKEEYWFKEKTDSGWSQPISAGEEVNAIGVHWPCSLDKNGNLYFSEFADSMYISPYSGGIYQKPIPLPEFFSNKTLIGCNPFISPDADYLIFTAKERLLISFKKKDNSWTDPIDLGDEINATHVNGSARVTADGNYLFFVSAGQGRAWGIYWVTTDFINRLRLEHLSEE